MNEVSLVAYFDRIANAPDAVPRLRRFILDLAVRGKLVQQDPNDEPASLALDRVKAAKVARGRVEKRKKETRALDNAQSFLLPIGWVWASLTDLVTVLNGRAYSQNELLNEGTPVLRVGNLFTSRHWYYSNLELDDDKYCDRGDLIFAWSASFGPFIWQGPRVIYHYHIWKLELHSERNLDKLYLCRVLSQKTQEIRNSGHGISMLHMTKEKMERLQVALPPLAEQRRIVGKVDELMGLCDRLEAAQTERESRRRRLAMASLHALSSGANEGAFRGNASFFLGQLPRLTVNSKQVKQLRQMILNLAVRGRLVAQDSNDESAAQLLGDRRLSLDSDAEPWILPSGWAWSSFDSIGETLGGGTPSKADPDFWNGSIPWVSPKDMKVDVITDSQDHISTSAVEHSAARLIPTGSLLMVVRGMILAHSFPTAITAVPVTINQDMKAIVPFRADLIRFLLLLTQGLKPEVLRLVLRSTHGTCKLLTEDLFSLPIPIPPLPEQHRIVARVEQLMELCDGLQRQLGNCETESRLFLESVLSRALEEEAPDPESDGDTQHKDHAHIPVERARE